MAELWFLISSRHSLFITGNQQWSGPKLGWHKDDVNPHLLNHINHLFDSSDDYDGADANIDGTQIFVPLCGKSVDLAYLASHPKVSQVVGIDILRTAAEEFAAEHPEILLEEVHNLNECELETATPTTTDAEQSTTTCASPVSSSDPGSVDGITTFRGKNLAILIGNLFDFLPMAPDDRAKYLLSNVETPPPSSTQLLLFDTIYDRASLVAIQPTLRQNYVTLMGELLRPGGNILLVTLDRRVTTTDAARMDGPPFSVDEEEVRQLYETQSWVESVTLLEEVDDLTTDADKERWSERGVLQLYELVFVIKKKNEWGTGERWESHDVQ